MKAKLEFNLPEEQDAHTLAIKGPDFYCCLRDVDYELRNIIKYGHSYNSVEELAEYLRGLISDNVDLDCVS